jgi:ubiquinone/menaquinone biosynthesis C-methylase UbiE
MKMEGDEDDWWRIGFSKLDLIVDQDVYFNISDAQKEVSHILKDIPKNPHFKRALDVCCGTGRHAYALKSLGIPIVVGIDYSLDFISEGKRRVYPAGPLIRADARFLPFPRESFDIITCFGNSLGYGKELDDQKILREANRVAKSRGIFILDITEKDFCLNHLKKYSVYRYLTDLGEIYDEYRRRYDEKKRSLICCQSTYINGKLKRRLHYKVRLYSDEEIVALCEESGWKLMRKVGCEEIYGKIDEGTLGMMAKRNFYVFNKQIENPNP